MFIPEAAMSYFSVFVRSVGTWFIVGRKSCSRTDPKGQNRMPKSGVRKETDKFLTFSQHSSFNHNTQSSVLFYVHCSVQVGGVQVTPRRRCGHLRRRSGGQ